MELAQQMLDNDGELTEDMAEQLAINEQNLQTKATNYSFVIKQMNAEEEIIENEMKRLQALKVSRAKSAQKLKNMISSAMELYGIEEIKTPIIKINFRKSESVEVENVNLLDPEFVTEKVTKSADKAAIKEAIKSGKTVTGAVISINKNLQIK